MKKKILKITSLIVMSTIAFFTLGIFLVGGMTMGYALAVSGNGMFFVGSSATMNVKTGTTISGNSATNGGGIYVASGGTLNMSGGTISGNTATTGNGHNIYNDGTFTMTGGTVGTSGSSQTGYGIYNTGTMNLYGGTINDSIYSSKSFNTKIGATISGTITLSDSATINVVDYAGTTPTMKISVSNSRANGTILTLKGNVATPDLAKLNVSGFDSSTKEVQLVQGTSSTEWNIVLAKRTFTVVFDANGGECSQSNIEMTLGEYYSGSVSVPTRLGYRFNGYYLLRGSSKIYYFNASGLSIKACDFTDDEVSDGVVTLKADWSFIAKTFTRVNNKGIEDSNGDYVLYGMYPQTKVTKGSIISLLNTNADADGYSYLYNDAYLKYNGSWFKIEPIMWEIVETHETDFENGDNSTCYTLVATKILDLSIFNNSSGSSSSLYQYDNVFWWRDEYKSVLFDNVCDIVNKYGNWYFGSMYAWMNSDNIGVYNYDDTYYMKTYNTNGSFQTIYSYSIRVPSYTDLSTYSGKITEQKTATDFAQAKGSDSTWWLASGVYDSNSLSWCIDANGNEQTSSITESKGIVPMIRINDYYLMDCGHVCDIESLDDSEMIVEYDDDYHWHAFVGECIKNCGEQKTFLKHDETEHTLSTTETISSYDNTYHYVTTTTTCSGCDFKKVTTTKVEHDTTTSYSYSYIDGGSTHTKSSTTKCKYCDYKTTSTTTMAHIGGTTVSTTYSDNGDGTHTITTTKKGCSVCGTTGEYTTTSSVKHTTTTVSTTTAYDDTNHWTETTTKCSYCSYQNVAKSNIVAHTLKETSYYEYNSTKHWLCTYQLCERNCGYHTDPTTGTKVKHILVNGSCACGYGTLAFTSSKHSHTCENCNNISIVQEVFFDEKKNKSQVLFIVDEKRYFSENYEAKNFQI